jgi:hypothetical protein
VSNREPSWLPLELIELYVPLARELGVSEVARSRRGFLRQYQNAGGDPDRLTDYWRNRRNGFVARHLVQQQARGEPLFVEGVPTRRHLALIMWAYSPRPSQL